MSRGLVLRELLGNAGEGNDKRETTGLSSLKYPYPLPYNLQSLIQSILLLLLTRVRAVVITEALAFIIDSSSSSIRSIDSNSIRIQGIDSYSYSSSYKGLRLYKRT